MTTLGRKAINVRPVHRAPVTRDPCTVHRAKGHGQDG